MNAPVPFDYQIWGPAECAEYFGQSRETFLRDTRNAPGFPKELTKGPKNRWPAMQVVAWVLTT